MERSTSYNPREGVRRVRGPPSDPGAASASDDFPFKRGWRRVTRSGGKWLGRARRAWSSTPDEGRGARRPDDESTAVRGRRRRGSGFGSEASGSSYSDGEVDGMAEARVRRWVRRGEEMQSVAHGDVFHAGKVREKSSGGVTANRMARGDSAGTDWPEEATCAPIAPHYSFKVGIYGWRKRCLYLLILGLLVMVIVNLALTLWLLRVMEFSAEGMGQLRIVAGGVQLSGQALVLDALVASAIRSRRGQPLSLESSRNFTVNARGPDGRVSSRIFLGSERLDVLSRALHVTDPQGATLFAADSREVVVGAEELRVTGEGGAIFDGTVQTPLVRADSGNELRLESPTRALEVRAPLGVAIESRAGSISASCLADLKLQSLAGAIRLDAANVFVPGLRTALPSGGGTARGGGGGGQGGGSAYAHAHEPPPPPPSIYQLCVCSNGKLFLAQPQGLCAVDEEDSNVCR